MRVQNRDGRYERRTFKGIREKDEHQQVNNSIWEESASGIVWGGKSTFAEKSMKEIESMGFKMNAHILRLSR